MRASDLLLEPVKKYRASINPPYKRKDLISILGTIFILLAIPLTVFVAVRVRPWGPRAAGTAASPTTIGSVIEPGSMVTEATYVIFVDGSNYYARNGKTGEIQFSGTDADTVIKLAMDALPVGGGVIELSDGTFGFDHSLNISTPAGMTVTLRGKGGEATKLDFPKDLKTTGGELTRTSFLGYQHGITDRNGLLTPTEIQGTVILEDMEIDGNQQDDTTPDYSHAHYMAKTYMLGGFVVRRCFVHDYAGNAYLISAEGKKAKFYIAEDNRFEDFDAWETGPAEVSIFRRNIGTRFGAACALPINGQGIIEKNTILDGAGRSIHGIPIWNSNIFVIQTPATGYGIIQDNYILNPRGSPIGWDMGQDNITIIIRGNTIRRTEGTTEGIGIIATPNTLRTNSQFTIEDNYMEYSETGSGSFIEVRGYSNVTIRNNVINNSGYNWMVLVAPMGTGGKPQNIDIAGNRILGTSSPGSGSAIQVDAQYYKVRDNTVAFKNIAGGSYAIEEFDGAGPGEIYDNDVSQANIKTIHVHNAGTKIWGNKGYSTENSGTATIASGSLSATFAHGLVAVPTVVMVTPQGNPGSGGIWVSAKDGTNITVSRSSTSGDLPISWKAEVK